LESEENEIGKEISSRKYKCERMGKSGDEFGWHRKQLKKE
jgi:hypothetical protein